MSAHLNLKNLSVLLLTTEIFRSLVQTKFAQGY